MGVQEMERLIREVTVPVVLPVDSRSAISAHGFWKRGTTAMFELIIVNLDVGSYLRMTPKKVLAHADKDKKYLYLLDCL